MVFEANFVTFYDLESVEVANFSWKKLEMWNFAHNGGLCNRVNERKEIQEETFSEVRLPFSSLIIFSLESYFFLLVIPCYTWAKLHSNLLYMLRNSKSGQIFIIFSDAGKVERMNY